jgi:Polyketide cyclase / dehydrase and lipid transport
MPVLKSFLSLILVFIIAIFTLGFFLPKKEKIIATRQMSCPAEKVFNQVNDLKLWGAWSAWDRYDPTMAKTYSASTVGKGASYSWKGNRHVGQGELTIVESIPNEKINTLLNYNYEGNTPSGFEFVPNQNGTEVRWWMEVHYPSNPILKAFFGGYSYALMNYFLQKDFNAGLDNLSQTCI